jgi:hypothetical protein
MLWIVFKSPSYGKAGLFVSVLFIRFLYLRLVLSSVNKINIVTCNPIAKQRPQRTRGQQYWGIVFFVSVVKSHNSG